KCRCSAFRRTHPRALVEILVTLLAAPGRERALNFCESALINYGRCSSPKRACKSFAALRLCVIASSRRSGLLLERPVGGLAGGPDIDGHGVLLRWSGSAPPVGDIFFQ